MGVGLRVPRCTHRPPCPGCPRYGADDVAPQAMAALEQLATEAGISLDTPVVGDPIGHRHRARLMVRGRWRSPKIGLFQEGTHKIVDTPRCHIHHPAINRAAAALKRAIRATRTPPYADRPHTGLVRALQVVVGRDPPGLQIVVVMNDRTPASASDLLEALVLELEDEHVEFWWNGNPERTNTILGSRWLRLKALGETAFDRPAPPYPLSESIGGARIFYPPDAFGQSHLNLADSLVEEIHACVPPEARVAEFYAGCGAIGLGLVRRGHEVRFNERGDASLGGLARGIAALGEDDANATVHPGAAGDHVGLIDDSDVVIVDPPRKGLEDALLTRLRDAPPERLIYVACGLQSFLRDARALLEGGRMALTRVRPYDLFPFTEHIETLAVFDRRDSSCPTRDSVLRTARA